MAEAKKKKLRSGYTTGACAAAAAKAATVALYSKNCPSTSEIPFPDGSRVIFSIHHCEIRDREARCSVIKDAGDDPDVTNGAEIIAVVSRISGHCAEKIKICGGKGVGRVTKRGLAIDVGQDAINPVPRKMISQAVLEAVSDKAETKKILVTIMIVDGEKLAEKTLNRRLGIIGGLSILGTTGIVRPISAEAWTATISASMSVAREAGLNEMILSTGRTSEAAVQKELDLPEEACAMMGDYLEFSLKEAAEKGFKKIHLAAMWAKVLKGAMQIPQTHVRHGALEISDALLFLAGLGLDQTIIDRLKGSNTAREIYIRLHDGKHIDIIESVCRAAQDYAAKVSGLDVTVYLVDGSGQVVTRV